MIFCWTLLCGLLAVVPPTAQHEHPKTTLVSGASLEAALVAPGARAKEVYIGPDSQKTVVNETEKPGQHCRSYRHVRDTVIENAYWERPNGKQAKRITGGVWLDPETNRPRIVTSGGFICGVDLDRRAGLFFHGGPQEVHVDDAGRVADNPQGPWLPTQSNSDQIPNIASYPTFKSSILPKGKWRLQTECGGVPGKDQLDYTGCGKQNLIGVAGEQLKITVEQIVTATGVIIPTVQVNFTNPALPPNATRSGRFGHPNTPPVLASSVFMQTFHSHDDPQAAHPANRERQWMDGKYQRKREEMWYNEDILGSSFIRREFGSQLSFFQANVTFHHLQASSTGFYDGKFNCYTEPLHVGETFYDFTWILRNATWQGYDYHLMCDRWELPDPAGVVMCANGTALIRLEFKGSDHRLRLIKQVTDWRPFNSSVMGGVDLIKPQLTVPDQQNRLYNWPDIDHWYTGHNAFADPTETWNCLPAGKEMTAIFRNNQQQVNHRWGDPNNPEGDLTFP